MEADDLARRIIFDISMVFKRQPNIDEFDIVPVMESQNKSPVLQVNTKMALEAWCVKLLYMHIHSNLIQWIPSRRMTIDDQQVAQLSEVALLLNPECLTFWNVRRELVCRGKLEQSLHIESDLRLCRLILTRKPKSPEVFCYRRWLVKRLLSNYNGDQVEQVLISPATSVEEIRKNEFLLCTIAASRYPNNYSAWSHRQWIHDNITSDESNKLVYLFKDLKWSEEWIQRNVSDHSGFHFRQYLLTMITRNGASSPAPSVLELLASERDLARRLICEFPGHETLWYHCRYLMQSRWRLSTFGANNVTTVVVIGGPTTCKKTKIDEPNGRATTIVQFDFQIVLDDEMQFTDEHIRLLNRGDDFDAQSNLAIGHKKWLSNMFEVAAFS